MKTCIVLDDYQKVAAASADWSRLAGTVDVRFLHEPIADRAALAAALAEAEVVVAMRERTAFDRALLESLPKLELLVTTGMRNAAIDLAAARRRSVTVCGTEGVPGSTAELAFGLILALARRIPAENAHFHGGGPWQTTLGLDLAGRCLGILGLGRLGARVARVAKAFEMEVVAWSQNLTEERCREAGAERSASLEALLERADFVTIHMVLSERTRGLLGAAQLARMKREAYLINTSRGPIVDEAALVAALSEGRIAGAGLDVFDREPLSADHPLRRLANVIATPHLGYVTDRTYAAFFGGVVEDIAAWLAGAPVRVIS